MFRAASKLSLSRASLVALTSKPCSISCTKPSPPPFRSFTTGLELEANMTVPDAIRMTNYALRQWRSDRSLGAYRMGLTVLKLCITNVITEGKDPVLENSKGMALLTMATILHERGEYTEAIERLDGVQELTNSYLGVRVAAFEAQAGLYLELGQDDLAAAVSDKCMAVVEKEPLAIDFEAHHCRARALKGLIELVNGNIDAAEPFFDKSLHDVHCDGTAALTYAEFLHITQKYKLAKEVYRSVVHGAIEVKNAGRPYLGAGNMSLDDLIVGSMCSLGQLEVLMGNFSHAEHQMTQSLSRAEEAYGSDTHHPKLGAVLTSTALMYKRKAMQERSSSLLIQEGLYRRVLDILKVPTTEIVSASGGAVPSIDRSDIEALTRGAYAEVLSVQENRKEEGEKMKNLAESMWTKNRRLSLADALDTNKVSVVDARINRVL